MDMKMRDVYPDRGFDKMTPEQKMEHVDLLRNVLVAAYFEIREKRNTARDNSEHILPQDLDKMIDDMETLLGVIAIDRLCERDMSVSDMMEAKNWLT